VLNGPHSGTLPFFTTEVKERVPLYHLLGCIFNLLLAAKRGFPALVLMLAPEHVNLWFQAFKATRILINSPLRREYILVNTTKS
jgi:hypothetical protein